MKYEPIKWWILLIIAFTAASCSSSNNSDPLIDGDADQAEDGDTADGEAIDGDTADGDDPDGDLVDGDAVDGDGEIPPDTGSKCDIDKNLNDRDVIAKEGGTVQICEAGNPLDGVRMKIPDALIDDVHVVISQADEDLEVEGWIPLGPPILFRATVLTEGDEVRLEDDAEISIPFYLDDLPELGKDFHINVVHWIDTENEDVYDYNDEVYFMPKTPSLIEVDHERELLSFVNNHFGIYQAMVPAEILPAATRHFTYRGISGISMGAFGGSIGGVKNIDEFDLLGPMGGIMDLSYLITQMHDAYMGGFCSRDEILVSEDPEDIDAFVTDQSKECGWCGPQTKPEQWSTPVQKCYMTEPKEMYAADEHAQGYNHWYYDDNGGNFNRTEYLDIFRDLGYAYGNPTSYNPDSAYLAAGLTGDVDDEETRLGYYMKNIYRPNGNIEDHGTACTNLAAWMAGDPLLDFYDAEWNPDGKYPVIYYCEGASGRKGDWDPAGEPEVARSQRFDMGLAVDYNMNGVRDYGEPIIRQFWEPYGDCGVDGLCNADESGYNADSNPDPEGDDYNPYVNPTGTEGNMRWDENEPYEDLGTDGVACPDATCPFDFGEGNNKFDYNPNVQHYINLDPVNNVMNRLTDEQLMRISIWADAGIRDIFNFVIHGDNFNAALRARLDPLGIKSSVFQGFPSLMMPHPEKLTQFRFLKVNYANLGHNVLMRFGNYDATDSDVLNGDGRHVGFAPQVVFRVQTFFSYANTLFPNGDFTPVDSWNAGELLQKRKYYSPSLKRDQKYSIAFPTGYFKNNTSGIEGEPDTCVDRYPVIALGHGYGMEPEEMAAAIAILFGYMANGTFQKIITIFPDGKCTSPDQCRDNCNKDCTAAPDKEVCRNECEIEFDCENEYEECEQGNMYSDHVATKEEPTNGQAPMETAIMDLFDYVDTNFCTKAPEDVEVDGATRFGLY